MAQASSTSGSAAASLRASLLAYCESPGKYQVASRQPQQLFASLREVLQIAVGREGEESAALRDAARFFVRTALLYPGADHYALLGVDRKVETADLKDRYRLLMRLLHPDFSNPGENAWPADSAVRVNRAYDTLSSAVERRLYDETLTPAVGPSVAHIPEVRRARPMQGQPDGDSRQSRFKALAVVCALASVALALVILFGTSSPDSAHLVQRERPQPEPTVVAGLDRSLSTSPVAKFQEMLTQVLPTPSEPPPRPAAPAPVVRAAGPATQVPVASRPAPPFQGERTAGQSMLVSAPMPAPEARPEPIAVAAVPAPPPPVALAPAQVVVAPPPPAPVVAAVAPPQPAPKPVPKPAPTLIEAQPLLLQLLQSMESGRGDRILTLLDPDARNKPSAQALSRQYDSIVDGARPVRVFNVEFKAEPGDGRLLVVGSLRVVAGEQPIGAIGKRMVLRAEFVSREGNVVITGLSGGPVN